MSVSHILNDDALWQSGDVEKIRSVLRLEIERPAECVLVDRRHYTRVRFFEIFANVLVLGAAVIMSVFPPVSMDWRVFAVFLSGHAIWTLTSVARRTPTMFWLNISLLALDCYAVIVRY